MQTHINIFSEDANGVHINKINDDYLARYSKKVVGEHRDKEELDHPDGSVRTKHVAGGAVTEDKLASGAVTRDKIKGGEVTLDCFNDEVKEYIERQGWATMVITKTGGVYKSNSTRCQQGQIIVVRNETGGQFISVTVDVGSGSLYTYTFDRYIGDKEVAVCRWAEMGHSASKFETIMTLSVDEKVASSDILDGAVGMSKLDEEVIGKLDELETAISEEVEARQTLDKNLAVKIEGKADDIHEHTIADITDLGDKITGLETDISDEALARKAVDDALGERITAVEQGGASGSSTISNCFNPLKTYDTENVITDINGNVYIGQSMTFGGNYANYTVDVAKFAKSIAKGEVTLKIGFAHLHMGIDECDVGGFAPNESSLTVAYADGTTETATFAGSDSISVEYIDSSKNITFVEGHPEGYSYSLYTFRFENTKEITEVKFSLKFDNYYADTPADGGSCIQNVYIDTLACYDEECVVTREMLDEMLGEQGGSSITVDSELSDTSENPVQNKVVKEALETTKTNMDSVVMGIESRLLAELDKKYEIPNENADIFLQYIGTDESGNGLQLNYDLFVPYIYVGNDGGNVILENVACLEFKDSNGFKDIDEITQAIIDLQDRISALEG